MNSQEKIIIIIDCHYFDVTEYSKIHPGGIRILKNFHLKDATESFNQIKGHSDGYALGLLDKFCIGKVNEVNINDYI